MEKIILKSLLLMQSLLLLSCGTCDSTSYNRQEIRLMSCQSEFVDSLYFRLSDVVQLENNKACVVNSIDKVLNIDDELYIFNSRRDEVAIFGLDGRHHRTINKVGRGKGEYIQLIDFTYDRYKDELLFLVSPSSIYHYSKHGDFIKKEPLKEYFSYVGVDSTYYYYYYVPGDIDSKHLIKWVNKKSGDAQTLLTNEYSTASHCTFGASMFQNERVLFVKKFDQNIYELSNGQISRIFSLDLGTKRFDVDKYKEGMDCTQLLSIGMKDKSIYTFSRVMNAGDFLMFSSNLFDLNICKDGKCVNYTRMRSSKFGIPLSTYIPVEGCSEVKTCFVLDDFTISSYKRMFKKNPESKSAINDALVEMIETSPEGSNPLLFIYEVKK